MRDLGKAFRMAQEVEHRGAQGDSNAVTARGDEQASIGAQLCVTEAAAGLRVTAAEEMVEDVAPAVVFLFGR